MDIEEVLRFIRIAAAHRQMQEQGRLLRKAIEGLTALGLSIDDILRIPTSRGAALPRPTTRKRKPPKPPVRTLSDLIRDTKASVLPTTALFTIIRNSGWDYTGDWKDYTPDEVRGLVADYADAPNLYISKLPRNKGRGAHAIIANWQLSTLPNRKPLNDPIDDLFRQGAQGQPPR